MALVSSSADLAPGASQDCLHQRLARSLSLLLHQAAERRDPKTAIVRHRDGEELLPQDRNLAGSVKNGDSRRTHSSVDGGARTEIHHA